MRHMRIRSTATGYDIIVVRRGGYRRTYKMSAATMRRFYRHSQGDISYQPKARPKPGAPPGPPVRCRR